LPPVAVPYRVVSLRPNVPERSASPPFGSGSVAELRSPIPSEWAPLLPTQRHTPCTKGGFAAKAAWRQRKSAGADPLGNRAFGARVRGFACLWRRSVPALELAAGSAWLGNGFRLEKGGGSGRRYLGLPGPRSRAPRAFLRPSGCGNLSAPILAPGFAVRCGGLRWAAPIPLAPLFGGF
jgi:hypothetical protein